MPLTGKEITGKNPPPEAGLFDLQISIHFVLKI